MTKTGRKILLSIVAFLAVICFAMSLNIGMAPKTAKAEGTISVIKVQRLNMQAFSSADVASLKEYMPDANSTTVSAYGWGSLFVVEFDKEIFSNASNGELLATASSGAVTAVNTSYDLTSIFNSITVGRKAASFASLAGGSKIYKHSSNSIMLKSNRVIGWASFTFANGMVVDGYTIDDTSTYWENDDWSFTKSDVEPAFDISNIWFVSTASGWVTINVAHNRALMPDTSARFEYIYINGNPICDASGNRLSGVDYIQTYSGNLINWGNEYDAGAHSAQFKLYISESLFNNELTITFKQGFKLRADQTEALQADKTFKIGKDSSRFINATATGDFSTMWEGSDLPVFVNVENEMRATEVNCISVSNMASNTHVDYTVKFDKAVFAGLDGNITDYLKSYTNFFRKIEINSMPLYLINNGVSSISRGGKTVTVTKIDDYTAKIHIAGVCYYADIRVLAGLRIGSYGNAYDDTFYQDNSVSDGESTFSKLDTAPEFKIFDVFVIPNGAIGSNKQAYIRVAFNQNPWIKQASEFSESTNDFSNGVTTNANISGNVFANGEQVLNGSGTTISAASEVIFGYTTANISIPTSLLDGNPTVLTFNQGWTVGYKTLAAEQSFVADSNDYVNWSKSLPTYTELTAQEITYKQGETTLGTSSATSVKLPAPEEVSNTFESSKILIGWTDGTNLYKVGETVWGLTEAKTFTLVELEATTVGMELKVWGTTSGARYLTKINYNEYAANAKFFSEYGTLMARDGEYTNLTIEEANAEGSKVKNILCAQGQTVNAEGYVEIRGGVENLSAVNYEKVIAGRAYLLVNYTSGADYVYSEIITRTMKSVAEQVIADAEPDEYSETAMNWLNTYAGIIA